MKWRISLTLCAATLATGCVNLPETKALITPVGVIGVHSFAPRHQTPRSIDIPTDAEKIAVNREQAKK
jgi:hypothetical protein